MYSLHVYTHSWCSDCQEGKKYLKKTHIPFVEHDLSTDPEKEEQLKKFTGSRVVPGFVFQKQSLVGKLQKPIVFTGFARNQNAIQTLVQQMKEEYL